jgi:hypothetical protein
MVVLAEPVLCALVLVMPEPVVMLELVVVIAESVVYALVVVMPKPVVMLEPVVMIAEPVAYGLMVVMLELLVYALVLPPLVVLPMMKNAQFRLVPAHYDPEMSKAVDQAVRYLIYAIGWLSQGILQGNAYHLQWGCLSNDSRSLMEEMLHLYACI